MPTQEMVNISDFIRKAYPLAKDCMGGHIGEGFKTFFEELADDRTYILVVERCGHCGMPTGKEDYATPEEEEKYWRGEAL